MGPEPYRHQERAKALGHWNESGTPEAKAAWDAEEDRLDRYVHLRSILLIGSFFVINGLLFYFFWNYGKKALQAPAAAPGS
jgi:heme/copper-type cytochrome/quinol oxidase subunit 2